MRASVLVLAFLLTSTAAAQDTSTQRFEKDPALATVLSVVVTGGGQIYTNQLRKGVTMMIVGAAAPIVGYVTSDTDSYCLTGSGGFSVNPNTGETITEPGTTNCYSDTDFTPLYVGIGVSAATWLWGVVTASSDARKYNAKVAPSSIAGKPGLSLRVSL